MTKIFNFVSGGPVIMETRKAGSPYPVRRIRLEDDEKFRGKYSRNHYVGYLVGNDAYIDLRKGDLLEAEMIFSVTKKRGRPQQEIIFSKVRKRDNSKDLFPW